MRARPVGLRWSDGLRRRLGAASRTDAVELLDGGTLTPAEVEANLRDLARLNRLPGGTAASMRAIRALVSPTATERIRILDAGTGDGDMPLAFARAGWTTVALDHNRSVLDVARRTTEAEPEVDIVEADARNLPFDDASFDVAHCSLVIHHLDPADAVRVLGELARVARRGIVVNDLRRGPLGVIATWLTTRALARSRVTRHDGMLSVRRAYTLDELDRLLADAGLVVQWRSAAWLPRVVTAAAIP